MREVYCYTAVWYPGDKKFRSIIEDLVEEHSWEGVTIVDVDDPDAWKDMESRKIVTVPTVVRVANDRETKRLRGAISRKELENILKP